MFTKSIPGTARAVLLMLLCSALPLGAQDTDAAQARQAIARLLGLVRNGSAIGDAALADVRAADADAAAVVLPATIGFGISAEEVPGGTRIDQAGSLTASAEWAVWRGRSASAARTAASARAAMFPPWRTLILDSETARAIEQVAIFSGARLRRARLEAESGLLELIEPLLIQRLSAGSATYLEVLRLRTARLQIAAEMSRESATATAARSTLLASLRDDLVRDSVQHILDHLPDSALLLHLATDDTALPAGNPTPLVDAITAGAIAAAAARRAIRSPSLETSLGVQRFADDDGWSVGPSLGVRFNVPAPFGGGRLLADAAAADIAAVRARLDLATIRSAAVERIARGEVTAARERLELLSRAVLDGAPEEREAALTALRSGRISLIELLDFERALSRAAMERIDAMVDAAAALARVQYLRLEPYLSIELPGGSAR